MIQPVLPAAAHAAATLVAPPPAATLALPATLLAACVPTLLAYSQPPSATLLNQCVAVALWGGVVIALPPGRPPRAVWPLLAALAVVALGALASSGLGTLPWSLGLQALGLLAGAALMLATGATAARGPAGPAAFAAFAAGLLLAGVLGAGVALVQVFAPGWTDGNWIAHSGLVGRAVGNLRQPNHLCSLLLWALVAAVALQELRWLPRAALAGLALLLVLAVELTASRTGAVGLALLLAWGLLDRRLSPTARWVLVATPVLYALCFGAMAWWGDISQQALGAGARVAAEGAASAADSPNSRLNIWRNALALIAANPWGGVGFGEFNLAWTLTAFAHRPTAFFDHTHNLALQLAVELGLPAATLVLGLLALALWRGGRLARRSTGPAGHAARAAAMLVLIAMLHSLVEYPLWYAYFLLPTALAWGFVLGSPAAVLVDVLVDVPAAGPAAAAAAGAPSTAAVVQRQPLPLWGALAGLLMAAGGALAVLDYQRVVLIYAPTDSSGSLEARIIRGQRSPLFAHHADYAACTNPTTPASAALGFARAPHSLLDTRLMVAWAQDLAGRGRTDQARWLAARLREFDNRDADVFFEPCATGDSSAFQCQPPAAVQGWRGFLAGARGAQAALPAAAQPAALLPIALPAALSVELSVASSAKSGRSASQ